MVSMKLFFHADERIREVLQRRCLSHTIHYKLTWRHCKQFLLNTVDQVLDALARASPEHQAVSWIEVTRLYSGVAQSE
jgi:hypothetical protein